MKDNPLCWEVLDAKIKQLRNDLVESNPDLSEILTDSESCFRIRLDFIEETLKELVEKVEGKLADLQDKNNEITHAYIGLLQEVGKLDKELEGIENHFF